MNSTVLNQLVLSPDAKHYHALRDAFWLYTALLLLANEEEGSIVHTSLSELEQAMGVNKPTLAHWLGRLRNQRLVQVQRQRDPPRLTIRLLGLDERVTTENQDTLQKAKLLCEGLKDNEENLESYLEICQNIPWREIEEAYKRARAVPEERIRKSRAALFKYLISKKQQ